MLEGSGEDIGGYCEAQQLVGQVKPRYYLGRDGRQTRDDEIPKEQTMEDEKRRMMGRRAKKEEREERS